MDEPNTDQVTALQFLVGKATAALKTIADKTSLYDEDGEPRGIVINAELISEVHELAATASRQTELPTRPPVPWESYMMIQAEFLKVATALGVKVETGMPFKEVADACALRAKVLLPDYTQLEKVLALLDGTEDALGYAQIQASMSTMVRNDLQRAAMNLRRALPLLRELAGKG